MLPHRQEYEDFESFWNKCRAMQTVNKPTDEILQETRKIRELHQGKNTEGVSGDASI